MRDPGGGLPALAAAATVVLALVLAAGCSETGGPAAEASFPDAAEPSWTEFSVAPQELTEPPTPAPTPARAVELRKAVAAGQVAVAGKGDGLERLEITVTSRADEPLRVVVNPGTIFDARASGTQAMVVISKEVIAVEPGASEKATLEVACSEMHKDQPGSDDTFRLVRRALPDDLVKLLAQEGFPDEDFRIQQFAVWTILDDPARNGFVRLGTSGVGTGPSSKEIAAIRALFAEAGIDAKDYRATR